MSRRLTILSILFSVFSLLLSLSSQAQVWNLSDDFSVSNNPNGAWSYGSKSSLNAQLNLYPTTSAIPTWYSTTQLAGWSNNYAVPYILKNVSNQDWIFAGQWVLRPAEVLLHPDAVSGESSVVRWSAPSTGIFTVQATFRRFQSQVEGSNSFYAVVRNGAALPGGSGLLSGFAQPDSSVSFTNSSLSLNVGDTLEFVVGQGTDGTSNSDATTVSAVISIALATITGRITLQGAIDQAQPVTFEFRPADGTSAFTRTVTLNSNRTYTLPGIPLKEYTVWVKGTKWLAKTLQVDAHSGNVSNVNATLPAGDANNDNSVDALDLAELITVFNTEEGDGLYNPIADFNTDGFVDALDLAYLVDNFNTEGEP